jgi:hypothetical protein
VVFGRNGFLHERFVEDDSVNFDVIFAFDEFVALWVAGVPVENGIPWDFDALLVKNRVDLSSVLDVVLHLEIVEHVAVPKLRIFDRLLQWKAFRMERNQTVDDKPIFDLLLKMTIEDN